MNPSTVYFQQKYVIVVIVCRHEKIIWKLTYHLFIENIFNMTKPKIYDSSRGRPRAFMRDDIKTNDVFAMTSLKGQTFKYFARSSDFPEGKRSMRLLCAFFKIIFLLFLFWFNLDTFAFPSCEFRFVQWSGRTWLERVPLCPHLVPQSELNLCKVQGKCVCFEFTGYLCVQDLQQYEVRILVQSLYQLHVSVFVCVIYSSVKYVYQYKVYIS